MNFGDNIKQLRIKNNLTQEELASRCDLSKGFISQIERDLTSPSIATLVDILESLGTTLKDFFSVTEVKTVFCRGDIFLQENKNLGYNIRWLIPDAQKNMMQPILLELEPSGKSENFPPHNGEVFGYVIHGTITLMLGSKALKVKKGESFYYKPDQPYFIENKGKKNASVLWVATPPNF